MDWRLTLAYRGGAYAGWQRQANAVAVQQVVEEALAQVLGRQVRVVGAGRTDAGVHARGQVASLALARPAAASALVHGTNAHLPDDVRVMAAAAAPAGFDARRHAAAKEYRYRIVRCEVLSPLEAPFAVRAEPGLDVAAMRAAAARLVGRHDWTAFARSGGSHTQPLRRIDAAEWLEQGEAVVFRIRGEGFLRGMVRAIVGTLLEVGRGRRSAASLGELLAGRPRAEAGASAPARGLVLEKVLYPPRWLAG